MCAKEQTIQSIHEYIRFNHDPDAEGISLEFRLTYKGKLPAASASDTRMLAKHEIRRTLHRQIRQFWTIHPELKQRISWKTEDSKSAIAAIDGFQIGNHTFLPLLSEKRGLACALDILFLRRDVPGRLITSGGDIDNRLKVLFDALRVPKDSSEIPKDWKSGDDEDPLYCLLQDDHLITTLNLTTDRLLTPLDDTEAVNDVVLIIQVKAIITNFELAPWGFIAN